MYQYIFDKGPKNLLFIYYISSQCLLTTISYFLWSFVQIFAHGLFVIVNQVTGNKVKYTTKKETKIKPTQNKQHIQSGKDLYQ